MGKLGLGKSFVKPGNSLKPDSLNPADTVLFYVLKMSDLDKN